MASTSHLNTLITFRFLAALHEILFDRTLPRDKQALRTITDGDLSSCKQKPLDINIYLGKETFIGKVVLHLQGQFSEDKTTNSRNLSVPACVSVCTRAIIQPSAIHG